MNESLSNYLLLVRVTLANEDEESPDIKILRETNELNNMCFHWINVGTYFECFQDLN